jgi:hypothetical protein
VSAARKLPPSPSQLEGARQRVLLAEGECAHWDFENPGGDSHNCCRELRAASAHLRVLRQRFKEALS